MKPGDVVVCVDALPERSRPVCTPLVAGRRYTVAAVRDANLGPPREPVPDEVMLVPGDGPTDRTVSVDTSTNAEQGGSSHE